MAQMVAVDKVNDEALITIPVITGFEVDTGSRTLHSPSALVAKYGPVAADYAAAARHSAAESVGPRIEAARHAVGPRVEAAREAVAPRVEAALDAVGPRVEAAREAVAPRVEAAREAVAPHVEAARDAAGPRAEAVRHAAMDRVGEARDMLEENLPRLAKSVASATEEAKHRSADAAMVLKGEATIKPKKSGVVGGGLVGNLLAALGVVVVAGAVAAYLSRRDREQDDPWARPLADPYVAPASGRVSTYDPDRADASTQIGDADVFGTSAQAAASAAGDQVPVMDPAETPDVGMAEVGVVDLTNDGMPPTDSADTAVTDPETDDTSGEENQRRDEGPSA